MILKVDDLTFKYNSHTTLRDVSFTVQRGEITVILGPNGVGKTTLLKCINSILSPLKGDVFINGDNTRKLNTMAIARQMSYVSQQSQAARMTAFDAILMGRRPHIRWRVSDDDIKKVDAAVKRLGLGHLAMKYTDQMSGGELQKVSIARALVQQTDLLLLDEPTSSLDMRNQAEILSLIKRVVKEHNVAAVMTMHDLNTALRYADKYIFLRNGSIFGAGDVKEICSKMVEAVYGISVEILHHNGNPVIIPDDGLKAA
ncbi:MAG: ABC transporter ATP-binding protein [Thermodesulfobacteriota bacterium]|nr:ABC transporter ATP-binding protein [Thermodesulfobacteriota bacterium]